MKFIDKCINAEINKDARSTALEVTEDMTGRRIVSRIVVFMAILADMAGASLRRCDVVQEGATTAADKRIKGKRDTGSAVENMV